MAPTVIRFMESKIMKTSKDVYNQFQALFEKTREEKIVSRAHILSLIFLSETEKAMDCKGWTKKRLAEEIGTSASYLTQLFRGDRLLNFKTIAKIEAALDVEFKIQEANVFEKSYPVISNLLTDK